MRVNFAGRVLLVCLLVCVLSAFLLLSLTSDFRQQERQLPFNRRDYEEDRQVEDLPADIKKHADDTLIEYGDDKEDVLENILNKVAHPLERSNNFEDAHDLERLTDVQENERLPNEEFQRSAFSVRPSWIRKSRSNGVSGVLNRHVWEERCGAHVEDLRRDPHFPFYPDIQTTVSSFVYYRRLSLEYGYGHRIFGYLHPPTTGTYRFAVTCGGNCEVWLSEAPDDTGASLRRLAWIGSENETAETLLMSFNTYTSQISRDVPLIEGKRYFIEALHKQQATTTDEATDHIMLVWLPPGSKKVKVIKAAYLSSFINETPTSDVNDYAALIPQTKASERFNISASSPSTYQFDWKKFGRTDARETFHKVPSVNDEDFETLLPKRAYAPSYIIHHKLDRFEGVNRVHETAVYPDDSTALDHMINVTCINYRSAHLQRHYAKSRKKGHGSKRKPIVRGRNKPKVKKRNISVNVIGKQKRNDLSDVINRKGRVLMSVDDTRELRWNSERNVNIPRVHRMNSDLRLNSERSVDVSLRSTEAPLDAEGKVDLVDILDQQDALERPEVDLKRDDTRDTDDLEKSRNKKYYFKEGSRKGYVTGGSEISATYDLFGERALQYLMKDSPKLNGYKYRHTSSICRVDGNMLLSAKIAEGVVQKYMQAVQTQHGKKYRLRRVVNVEENRDVLEGDRYLLELELEVAAGQTRRLSRYVFQPSGEEALYEPENFQWNKHSTVHVIITVRNQGRWLQYFINNMLHIFRDTNDERMNVIIVDFNSDDIDAERSLRNSGLKRYNFLNLNGPFHKTLAIQRGADFVKDPDDIVFMCDLHLEIPSQLIDNIRKHVVAGKMGYAPMVNRLNCGYTPELPYGLWEYQGYGLFALTKRDFDAVGGMNTKEFKTKWGGEDWELLDRVLNHGLEVERMRVPKLFHFHHSKKRMWTADHAKYRRPKT